MTETFVENLFWLLLFGSVICIFGALGAWACDWLDENWPME